MYPMKGIFKKNGWDVEHFIYPSWSSSIEDNAAFREFVVSENLDFSVLKFEGKFVGVIKKEI